MSVLLIADTCALLDLVRAPIRKEFHPSYAQGSRKLLDALRSAHPPARLIVPDIVQAEYARNVDAVTDDVMAKMTLTRDLYRQALVIFGDWSQSNAEPCVDDAWIRTAVGRARSMADDFLSVAAVEVATDQDHAAGSRRVVLGAAPSKRGKDSTADCIILEVGLRLARGAPASGIARTIFFSSNTTEYCDLAGLKSDLQSQFSAAGLEYARAWGEVARAILGANV